MRDRLLDRAFGRRTILRAGALGAAGVGAAGMLPAAVTPKAGADEQHERTGKAMTQQDSGTAAMSKRFWVRAGIWEGRLHPGMEERFVRAIEDDMVPALIGLPGVVDVQVLWPKRFENREPAIFCQTLVYFEDEAGARAMLSSPLRLAPRDRVHALAALYDGTLSHIEYACYGYRGLPPRTATPREG